ncbi:MAG: hypothetical protein ABGX07_09935 [Pirellulaceae bacterium]
MTFVAVRDKKWLNVRFKSRRVGFSATRGGEHNNTNNGGDASAKRNGAADSRNYNWHPFFIPAVRLVAKIHSGYVAAESLFGRVANLLLSGR